MNLGNYGAGYPDRVAASSLMPRAALREFYERFYARVRPVVGADVRLVFHDRFQLGAWNGLLAGAHDDNVWIDTHRYLCFLEQGFRKYDLREYERRAALVAWVVRRAARHHHVLVGEWSLANHSPEVRRMDEAQKRAWYRAFAEIQLAAWDQADGGCFWSYRVEAADKKNWSFVDCVERGWLSYA